MGEGPRFAGIRARFLALALDVVVLSAAFLPITRLAKGTWVMSAGDHRWSSGWFVTDPLCLAFLAAMVAYFVLLEGLLGATVGKRALGLRVVGEDGAPAGLVAAIIRNVLRLVDGLPAVGILAAILIASSPERARLGDRLAGTRVIEARTGARRRS